jgi:hypothetical protein
MAIGRDHPRGDPRRIELVNHRWRKVGGSCRVDRCPICGLNVLRGDRAAQVAGDVLHADCARLDRPSRFREGIP